MKEYLCRFILISQINGERYYGKWIKFNGEITVKVAKEIGISYLRLEIKNKI